MTTLALRRLRIAAIVATLALSSIFGPVRAENRSYDGSDNNPSHPTWGQTQTDLLRLTSVGYADGLSTPVSDRQSPRAISNIVVAQPRSIPNAKGNSAFVWAWGQFIDHDLDLVEPGTEAMNIPVPAGDPVFDPGSTGTQVLPFTRSTYDPATGTINARQQPNAITSWIDGSQVYGSDAVRAQSLRGVGGLMKVTPSAYGDLLPTDASGHFIAGDIRVEEQPVLSSMHTLFLREHNRLATQIIQEHPLWSGDEVYQYARKLVGAEIQKVTYDEFLPAILGTQHGMSSYTGWKSNVDPSIENAFAAAAFRFGHTALNDTLLRIGPDGQPIAQGNVALRDAFGRSAEIVQEAGIDPLLRGLAYQPHQEVDPYVVEDLRSFLFGNLDLPSFNIQRGRDHGLPDYNTLRSDYGLPKVTSFWEISSDPVVVARLQAAYATVDDIDPWIGMISEDHWGDSSFGPLMHTVIKTQFEATRAADRFWWETDGGIADEDRQWLSVLTLQDVIEMNTDIRGLPEEVFTGVVPEPMTLLAVGLGAAAVGFYRRRLAGRVPR